MQAVAEIVLCLSIPFIPIGLWLWVVAFKLESQARLIENESSLIWAQVKLLELANQSQPPPQPDPTPEPAKETLP